MKDLNQVSASLLPQIDQSNKQQFLKSLFDDWPTAQPCIESDDPTSMEVKKWRLQIVLAVNPYGVPSLEYGRAYERMFSRKFDLREFGCDCLSELINKMPEIFAIQEPDEVTGVLFPDYPNDRILHDARLGLDFAHPNLDGDEAPLAPTSRVQAEGTNRDFSDLISRAWMDRDEDFPPDVVLAGESYEQLWRISSANIPGTKGLYQAAIISVASPDSIFIQLNNTEEDVARIRGLSDEIARYFKESTHSIDAYNVPREFMLPGFPCLLYLGKQRAWERCIIAGRSQGEDHKIVVESIDFGGTYAVHQIFLYLIPRKFLQPPRQTFQVSMMNLKPLDGNAWTKQAGSRLRCFSFENYWLDVLLIEPKITPVARTLEQYVEMLSICDSSPDRSSSQTGSDSGNGKLVKRKIRNRISYEALIVDRNDKDIDLYVDEVLVLETYSQPDPSRVAEVAQLKQQLAKALESIPRPKNPFE